MSPPCARVLFVVVVVATALVSGCGGGDGSSGSTDAAAQTARIGPAGGQLVDSADGILVTVPAGALATSTTVAMTVTRTHAPAVAEMAEGGRVLSEVGVQLTLPPAAFAPNGSVTIQMPLTGRYDPVHSIMAVASPANVVLAIPSLPSGDGASLVGTLDAATASALAAASGNADTFEVFTANSPLLLTSAPANGSALRFVPPASTPTPDCSAAPRGTPPPTNPCWIEIRAGDLAHKRVALLAHGFKANLGSMQSLAFHLRNHVRSGESAPYYDAVIGFDYDTNTGIAKIGALMAQQIAPLLQEEGVVVDVFGHSMGVVVARYAMETQGLPDRLGPKVSHFVALGGPNTGLPFADVKFLQTMLLVFRPDAAPALNDLFTFGIDGASLSGHPFLTDLNVARGPDFEKARYFSLSANDYRAEVGPPPVNLKVGEIVNAAYILAVGSLVNDGLVADYSAQSDVLSRQSRDWVRGPVLPVSHFNLHEPAAFPTIDGWIAGF